MDFSLADFEPKPNNWLSLNLRYEGPGSVDFTSPVGSVTGSSIATFNEQGEQFIEVTCEQLSCDPEYGDLPIVFLSGAKLEQDGITKSWGFSGLDNPCRELTITTPEGTFSATRVQPIGLKTQLVVAKAEDAKAAILRFHVSQGKFETGSSAPPKYFVLPLINCVAEPGNSLDGPSHPLRIYPTPSVPDSLTGTERLFAQHTAQKHNSVIGFYLSGRICFIERLPDYDERLASLQNGAQRTATAVLVGELGEEPVGTLSEFRSWFPMEVLSALSFVSGVDIGFPWIEIRDASGGLVRRLHGASWRPTFDEGDLLMNKYCAKQDSGIGVFLTQYLLCGPEKRSYVEAAMNHSRLGSLGISLRLYDILDHLIRALECLCREYKLTQQQLLPRLSPEKQGQVEAIRTATRNALQALINDAQQARQFDDARVLGTIRSKADNMASTEKKFGLAVVDLLKQFGLPDPNVIDAHIKANPRSDSIGDWASLVSAYRGATIHEGFMDFENKHDARDVARVCRHLKDVLTRILLKDVGYSGSYESVLRRSYGPQPIDWIQSDTEPKLLGFD